MKLVELSCDIGSRRGLAGCLAAISAARHGAKVVLVQDRSRLGEIHRQRNQDAFVGANNHKGRPGWREGGLLEEIRLDDAANNPSAVRSFGTYCTTKLVSRAKYYASAGDHSLQCRSERWNDPEGAGAL